MRFLYIIAIILIQGAGFITGAAASPAPGDTLVTPNPSVEAVAVYRYLLDMKGKLILSGQQDSRWGIDELTYIKSTTGRQPALRGMDFIHAGDNDVEVQRAIDWWKAGGIPTIMWHWGAPTMGDGYEQSKMTIDINRCFTEGTAEYTAFWAELKKKADLLQRLENAGVPVLWRPFHEFDGNWFWWSKQGAAPFRKLWTTMFDYFVQERGLSNLIWVLCYTSTVDPAWYPGDAYVDVVGADTYNSGDGPQMTMFNKLKSLTSDRYPIAYHECGIPPVPEECLLQGGMWSWWMEWHTDWLTDVDKNYLSTVYNHDLVVTLDEVPPLMEYYGNDTCVADSVFPRYQIEDGEWIEGNLIQLDSGKRVTLDPQGTGEGTWSWSGLGTTGSQATQTIMLSTPGSARGVFINNCGTATTALFHVIDTCPPVTITPRAQVQGSNWVTQTELEITVGQYVRLSPGADATGSWKWIQGAASSTREITVFPRETTTFTVRFTSSCGAVSQVTYTVVVQPVTKVPGRVKGGEFSVFPSPCRDDLFVVIPGSGQQERGYISLFTLSGELVLTEWVQHERTRLSVSGLKPGVYTVKYHGGSTSYEGIFIKAE